MKNVEIKIEGDVLTIKVDLTKRYGRSASGKTVIIASSVGNVPIDDSDMRMGLNIYVPASAEDE